ncbi:MAG: enoyl-CoA hydratase/isomerase family protein, partial [Sinobacteraceae bacterium]|nr:enoyl-CoA hydratase/isomerase family protein [Nevskiaceae bacterium]
MIDRVQHGVPKHAADLLIEPSRGWLTATDSWRPLGIVDLSACPENLQLQALPPYPVIGLGDPAHPFAAALDAIVEPPVSVDALIRQVTRAPQAAATAVQLLRALDGLPVDRALQLESMCYGLLQGSAEHAAWLASRAQVRGNRASREAVVEHREPAAARLIVERHDSVLHLVLNRPEARNAIDRDLRDQLFEAFTLATLDPDISAIQLRAVGPAFSIGGDLEEFGTTRDPATAHLIRSRTLPALALAGCAEILDVHVRGACVGAGVEMAAFARRVSAAPDAWFQLPELAMGLIPGA